MQLWMLRRHVHSSWVIALLAAGFVLGVIAAGYGEPAFTGLPWFIVAVIVSVFGLWKRRVYVIPLLVASGAMLGLWRGGLVQGEVASYKDLFGHTVTVRGVVSEDPELDEKGRMTIRLNVESIDDHMMPGALWLGGLEKKDIKRGDTLEVKGELNEGFGTFAASMFFAHVQRVVRPIPGDVAGRVREWFSVQVGTVIASPESALGIGFLTGQRTSLPSDLEEALKIAGLTHVVVASGYNLTILVRLARRVFVRISKYLAAASAGAMIIAFLAITGMSPSMSRASLVAGLSLLAWYYGRRFHPLVLLPLAAAITLALNPSFGWNDLGWQLSFAAFAGVMILAPLLQAYFFGDQKPGILRQIAGETIAAQLATLPILMAAFGQVSVIALVANLLIVPLIPVAMLLVFGAGILALVFYPLGAFIGGVGEIVLGYMIAVAQWCATVPWSVIHVVVPGWVGVLLYFMLAVACGLMWRATKYNLRTANIVE